MENQEENFNKLDNKQSQKIDHRSPLKDFTNIVVLGKSGGGGSPKSLPAKASDPLGQNKSETPLINRDASQLISPARSGDNTSPSGTKTSLNEQAIKESPQPSGKVYSIHHEEEEEEKFEDAFENKLSLTMLADDLDKIHLSTPGRIEIRNDFHEFVESKNYEVDWLHSRSDTFSESFEDSKASLITEPNLSLKYEVTPQKLRECERDSSNRLSANYYDSVHNFSGSTIEYSPGSSHAKLDNESISPSLSINENTSNISLRSDDTESFDEVKFQHPIKQSDVNGKVTSGAPIIKEAISSNHESINPGAEKSNIISSSGTCVSPTIVPTRSIGENKLNSTVSDCHGALLNKDGLNSEMQVSLTSRISSDFNVNVSKVEKRNTELKEGHHSVCESSLTLNKEDGLNSESQVNLTSPVNSDLKVTASNLKKSNIETNEGHPSAYELSLTPNKEDGLNSESQVNLTSPVSSDFNVTASKLEKQNLETKEGNLSACELSLTSNKEDSFNCEILLNQTSHKTQEEHTSLNASESFVTLNKEDGLNHEIQFNKKTTPVTPNCNIPPMKIEEPNCESQEETSNKQDEVNSDILVSKTTSVSNFNGSSNQCEELSSEMQASHTVVVATSSSNITPNKEGLNSESENSQILQVNTDSYATPCFDGATNKEVNLSHIIEESNQTVIAEETSCPGSNRTLAKVTLNEKSRQEVDALSINNGSVISNIAVTHGKEPGLTHEICKESSVTTDFGMAPNDEVINLKMQEDTGITASGISATSDFKVSVNSVEGLGLQTQEIHTALNVIASPSTYESDSVNKNTELKCESSESVITSFVNETSVISCFHDTLHKQEEFLHLETKSGDHLSVTLSEISSCEIQSVHEDLEQGLNLQMQDGNTALLSSEKSYNLDSHANLEQEKNLKIKDLHTEEMIASEIPVASDMNVVPNKEKPNLKNKLEDDTSVQKAESISIDMNTSSGDDLEIIYEHLKTDIAKGENMKISEIEIIDLSVEESSDIKHHESNGLDKFSNVSSRSDETSSDSFCCNTTSTNEVKLFPTSETQNDCVSPKNILEVPFIHRKKQDDEASNVISSLHHDQVITISCPSNEFKHSMPHEVEPTKIKIEPSSCIPNDNKHEESAKSLNDSPITVYCNTTTANNLSSDLKNQSMKTTLEEDKNPTDVSFSKEELIIQPSNPIIAASNTTDTTVSSNQNWEKFQKLSETNTGNVCDISIDNEIPKVETLNVSSVTLRSNLAENVEYAVEQNTIEVINIGQKDNSSCDLPVHNEDKESNITSTSIVTSNIPPTNILPSNPKNALSTSTTFEEQSTTNISYANRSNETLIEPVSHVNDLPSTVDKEDSVEVNSQYDNEKLETSVEGTKVSTDYSISAVTNIPQSEINISSSEHRQNSSAITDTIDKDKAFTGIPTSNGKFEEFIEPPKTNDTMISSPKIAVLKASACALKNESELSTVTEKENTLSAVESSSHAKSVNHSNKSQLFSTTKTSVTSISPSHIEIESSSISKTTKMDKFLSDVSVLNKELAVLVEPLKTSLIKDCSSTCVKENESNKEHFRLPSSSPVKLNVQSNVNLKVSPKRNLINDFEAVSPKPSFLNSNSNTCESSIEFRKENDTIDSIDFDERFAEEAANLSQHIQNLSRDMGDSDSDNDNNNTVISMEDGRTLVERLSSSSVPGKASASSPSLNSLRGLHEVHESSQSSDFGSVSVESCMQSMRSVLPSHLNQSEAGPITADELRTHDLEFQDGANLDLDYFTRLGDSDTVVKTTLTRDSLYVKFDPIVGAIVSNTLEDRKAMPPPSSVPEEKTSEEQCESKSNESKTGGEGDTQKTPGRSPALEAVQKLISLTPPSASSGTATPVKPDRSSTGTPTNSQKSPSISQEQLKKELKKLEELMKEREKYYETELGKRQNEMEVIEKELTVEASRRVELEAELKASSEREQRLKKEVQERTKSKQQLSLVMEEYEKTISQLVAQKEEEKKEFEVQKDDLMKERDTAMQHLNNMEIAFNDVHQKYERSKTVIEGMKANEDILKKSLAEYNDAIKTSNTRYESLKNHAIRQLETANQELDLIRRSHQAEIAKLNAMLKKAEVRVTSLEESLEQKSKENQELAAICDELINKVGSGAN